MWNWFCLLFSGLEPESPSFTRKTCTNALRLLFTFHQIKLRLLTVVGSRCLENVRGFSSFGRAPPCQGGGGGFEPRNPLQKKDALFGVRLSFRASISWLCKNASYSCRDNTRSVVSSSPSNPTHSSECVFLFGDFEFILMKEYICLSRAKYFSLLTK